MAHICQVVPRFWYFLIRAPVAVHLIGIQGPTWFTWTLRVHMWWWRTRTKQLSNSLKGDRRSTPTDLVYWCWQSCECKNIPAIHFYLTLRIGWTGALLQPSCATAMNGDINDVCFTVTWTTQLSACFSPRKKKLLMNFWIGLLVNRKIFSDTFVCRCYY